MQKFLALVAVGATAVSANVNEVNPLHKVIELLSSLSAKVTAEGEAEEKAYHEYVEWCDDTSKNAGFAITTAKNAKAALEAQIGELTGEISVAQSNIEDLAGSISTAEAELANSTTIRNKEHAEFAASEAELVDAIDTLTRAVGILEREMAKNPAFAQVGTKDINAAIQAISVVLDAAAFPSKDQAKLAAFMQAQQNDDSDDLEFGAPAASTYKTRSTGILDVLEDLKEKAEGQLADLRKAEVNSRHNFDMLKQSLVDQAAADTKDMDNTKGNRARAQEAKASAEGDLGMTNKELTSSQEQLAVAHATCLQVAADHETTVAARAEELKVIADAKKILEESSSGAVSQTYSFIQFGSLSGLRMQTRSDLAGSEVVAAVKQLAKKQHSAALAQLASRIATVLRYGSSNGEDPFAKVRTLISDMIVKLQAQAGSEATEKAYCDEQLAATGAKKAELEDDIAKMSSRIDQSTSKSAQLKEEVQGLENELAKLTREQAVMDKIRQETHAEYTEAKADLEQGLSGVRQAVQVLRDYYGSGSSLIQDDNKFAGLMQQPARPETHSSSQGAGDSIISLLEVVESDFATNLAKEETTESDAQSEYEKVSQENAVMKTIKEQDVKYKNKESKSLDKTVSEYSSDRQTANAEYSAVLEYYSKIKERCIAKPETYSDRSARRQAEIQGLKEALSILEDETALVQRKRRGHFRGYLKAF